MKVNFIDFVFSDILLDHLAGHAPTNVLPPSERYAPYAFNTGT